MIRGLYSAAAAMEAAAHNHDIVAHNLAHATVPGFRQSGLAFAIPDSSPGAGSTPFAKRNGTSFIDFQHGPIQFTGSPYDLAIDGDSFFKVQGPNGPLYTRSGVFHLNSQNQIVSQGGYPLLSGEGPIKVPQDAGIIKIGGDGTVSAGGVTVAKIQLSRFQDLSKLQPVGPTLFAAAEDANPQTGKGGVLQGYREGSNVNPAEAMVAMIAGARSHEASQRVLRAIGESLQLNTRPQS